MRNILTALSLITPLLAGAAAAQDADPIGQLVEGYLTCFATAGDVEMAVSTFSSQGWVKGDGEDGLIYLHPGAGDASFVYLADDGSFCHVESTSVDSATASEVLATALETAGVTDIEYNKDEMGCTQLGYGDGMTATITSGGNDPTCGSDTDSGVRFAFAATE